MDDPVARLRAEMDQAKEASKEYAATLWAFYDAAVEEGFTAEQALGLTIALLTTQLGDGR